MILAHISMDGDYAKAIRQPELLFSPPDPSFSNAMVDGQTVYVYGQIYTPMITPTPHVVARVPLEHVPHRDAYQFWNGNDWTNDIRQVATVMDGIPEAVTVSYNRYLGSYLAVHSLSLDEKIYMRTAPRPEGPWSEPGVLFQGKQATRGPDGMGYNYAGIEHPALSSENGKSIVCSYYNPNGTAYSQLEVVRVTFG